MNFLKSNINYLKKKGHSGYKIKSETGLAESTLSSFLNSTNDNISLKTLEKLYKYYKKFNISIDDLLFKDLSLED